jgi:broad specificity phosphatase PhoE
MVKPAMQIVFETHSTSVDNEAGLASGHFDVDLSPRGEREAEALGIRRRSDGIEVVYASDLRRSWRTAAIALGATGITIAQDPRLRECDYGRLTRHPVEEIETLRGRAVLEPFPGGESYTQSTARVALWLDDLQSQHLRRVLVIGHRATLYALEHLLFGVPLEKAVATPLHWQPGWEYEVAA